jgi:hypothetical protein
MTPSDMSDDLDRLAARRNAGFRDAVGRARCAVCGRAVTRTQSSVRIHGVPVHKRCAGFGRSARRV